MKNVPNIEYKPAIDNPIGGAVCLFFGLVTLFFISVTVMNLGYYGSVMRADNYIPLAMFILFFSIKLKVHRDTVGLLMEYSIWGVTFRKTYFESIEFVDKGKFSTAWLNVNGSKISTHWVIKRSESDTFRKLVSLI